MCYIEDYPLNIYERRKNIPYNRKYNGATNLKNELNWSIELSIIRFNVNGAKRNLAYIQHLLSYNCVVSLCDTWLLESGVNMFLKSLNNNFVIIQKADMLYAPISGRPFGGRAIFITKKVKVIDNELVYNALSYIAFKYLNNIISIIFNYAYLPYDNGTQLNFVDFQCHLQLIVDLTIHYNSKQHIVVVMGDFNVDI